MGKIRVKTLGSEEAEKKQAQKAKGRRETKKEKKLTKGAHGGERIVSMAPTEEELEKITVDNNQPTETPLTTKSKGKDKKKKSKERKEQRQRSNRYKTIAVKVDRNKRYSPADAIALLKEMGSVKFDSTVELHINTITKGISGQITLPHGSGKEIRVAIADASANGQLDALLAKIEKGGIDFDVLIATPGAMGKLAKFARVLGPKGLMPNPKNGTISETPEKAAEKFKGGALTYKTESQAPIIHTRIGKLSFKEKDLTDNIKAFLKAVGVDKIRNATIKSTMSPGIKVDLQSIT